MSSACSKVDDSLNRTSMDRAERRQRRLDQKNWGGVNGGKKRDISRSVDQETVNQRASKCGDCGSEEKKLTRRGPLGPRTLCNSCGQKWGAKRSARNVARNLQDTSSEGDSVEITVPEPGADMYIKDLERKLRDAKNEQQKLQNALQMSDVNLNKFRMLNDEKRHKIAELEMQFEKHAATAEAECIRLRSEVRCLEEKLRADVRCLEEKNRQLVGKMQRMNELLSKNFLEARKNFSEGKEILAESILLSDDNKSRSWRSGVVTDQQQQTGHYQESKKASNVLRTKYDEELPSGFDCHVDVDADIGDNEPDYPIRDSERLRPNRNLTENPGHFPNRGRGSGSDTAAKGRDSEWGRGYNGGQSDLGPGGLRDRRSDDLGNGDLTDRRSDEFRGPRKDVEGGPDKPGAGANAPRFHGGSSGDEKSLRPLISHKASLLARQHVDTSFITWVNSKLRKPTPEEMIYHKTEFTVNDKTSYWSGLSGSEILAQYEDACDSSLNRIPHKDDLEIVFRSILHIEACPMRPHDVLWCLVWQDCEKIDQLPGYQYTDVTGVRKEMRKARSPGASDFEDTDRTVRQRYAY